MANDQCDATAATQLTQHLQTVKNQLDLCHLWEPHVTGCTGAQATCMMSE